MESLGSTMQKMIKEAQSKHKITVDLNNLEQIAEDKRKHDEIAITKAYQKQKKQGILNSSLVSDYGDLESVFDDFHVNTPEQDKELSQAKNIANRVYQGEKGNYIFAGQAGLGKTMLAVCIMNGLNELLPDFSTLFVSAEMLLDLEKRAISDKYNIEKRKVYQVEKCIQECDLLVLDDLGSETSFNAGHVEQGSRFVQEVLFRVAEYRKNKTNIITTNNTGAELKQMYHGKITSRLLTKKQENIIFFKGKDMRDN